jgi:hypothetical protein
MEWTAHHFSISDHEANVARLLRNVADALDELGTVEVLDVTFCQEVEGSAPEARMTVYFTYPS